MNDVLIHYGTKGQRWGIRRYQNEDGSYKPGAEGRYYDELSKKANVVANKYRIDKTKKTSDIYSEAADKFREKGINLARLSLAWPLLLAHSLL